MAIAGPSSYVPCTNEFLPHWTSVDASFGFVGLRIPQSQEAVSRADFESGLREGSNRGSSRDYAKEFSRH